VTIAKNARTAVATAVTCIAKIMDMGEGYARVAYLRLAMRASCR